MNQPVIHQFVSQLNAYGESRTPCLFVVDFELQRPRLWRLADIPPDMLRYDFNGQSNMTAVAKCYVPPLLRWPVAPAVYERAFARVQEGIQYGDSFLCNLTFPTQVEVPLPLADLFHQVRARYRLWLKDELLCFSPETFVQLGDNLIHSFPMKGTQPARQAGDEELLLHNPKEKAEHATIVDLLRNDLSSVARRVRVAQYRYLEQLHTSSGPLWQTSSHITGELPTDWRAQLGDILLKLLPAGSVSGAPKPSTLRIIREAEGQERGYYTGIAGIFDGERLDSAVLIRFIEQVSDTEMRYWSGGGITARSTCAEEYQEMVDKVYLPAPAIGRATNYGRAGCLSTP